MQQANARHYSFSFLCLPKILIVALGVFGEVKKHNIFNMPTQCLLRVFKGPEDNKTAVVDSPVDISYHKPFQDSFQRSLIYCLPLLVHSNYSSLEASDANCSSHLINNNFFEQFDILNKS